MTNNSPAGAPPGNAAEHATQSDVLTHGKLNLLGVFGTDNDLQALVRLPGGRVRRVAKGARLVAGKVVAIDAGGLMLLKGRRSTRIALPGG